MHETTEVAHVVLAKGHVLGKDVEPAHLEHVRTWSHLALAPGEELGEVPVADPRPIREVLLNDLCENGLHDVHADLLLHFSLEPLQDGLAFLELSARREPQGAPPFRGNVTKEQDTSASIVEEPTRRPPRLGFVQVEDGVLRRDRVPLLHNGNASEVLKRLREPILAGADACQRYEEGASLFNTGPTSRERQGGGRMALDDVSDRGNKVYDVMKSAGMTSEDKMRDADAITKMTKLPKGMVLSALQELESKGYAKRRAREKAAGYYLVK